ncbi:MAG TPA: hypothetical protein VLG68_01535 [Gammaproteobacteria bacterium]|nr:hypothetical protein [Gammaproteobacteria bacterium]
MNRQENNSASRDLSGCSDAASVEAMLNEGAGTQAGIPQRQLKGRYTNIGTPPGPMEDLGGLLPATRLSAYLKAVLLTRFGGRIMHRNETHLNRGHGKLWLYWPVIGATAAVSIGGLIFVISVSGVGSAVALMLRQLI